MSELKEIGIRWEENGELHFSHVYLKSEADKVIRNHKYKRCLAMARWCASEENRLEAISPIFDTDKEYWEYNSDYWGKWHNRWLEIAEKFKEAK